MLLDLLKKIPHLTPVRKHVMRKNCTPTQVNAPWVLPPKADPPLAETQLLTEATPNPKQSQAPPWLFFYLFREVQAAEEGLEEREGS
jgi:hypothetical protein